MLDCTKEFKEVKIFSAVFWYIFSMFIVILFSSVIDTIKHSNLSNNNNLLSLYSSTLFILILFYKFKVNKNKLFLLIEDYTNKIHFKEIIEVVGTQLCLSMGLSLLLIGIIYFLFPNVLNDLLSQSSVDEISTYKDFFIVFLVSVICAPIMEELLFRAIIFKRISRRFNIYFAMIVSSLVFGLLHMELAIIGAFLFGIACCILYIKYKNILISMTIHFLNNLLAILPQLDINSTPNNSPITASDAKSSLICGSILFIIGMIFFIRFIVKNKKFLKDGFSPNSNNELYFK